MRRPRGSISGNIPYIIVAVLAFTVLITAWIALNVKEDPGSDPSKGGSPGSSTIRSGENPESSGPGEDPRSPGDRESLPPHASRSGETELRLPPRLHGVVIDREGVPVPGAEVHALRIEDLDGRRVAKARADTRVADDEGRFFFGEITPGTWSLHGFTRASKEAAEASPALAGQATALVASPHQHVEGGDRTVSIVLRPAGRIAGRVVGPAGDPVAGAQVFTAKNRACAVETDDAGRFALDRLAPGRHAVLALAEGFAQGLEIGVFTGESDLCLRLSEGAIITGRVLRDEHPMEGLRVQATRMAYDPILDVEGITDEQGIFRLGPLVIEGYSYGVATKSFFAPVGHVNGLGPGETRKVPPIHLEPAGSISGTIRDAESGVPVPGVWVRARPRMNRSFFLPRSSSHARSDASGRFRLGPLPSTAYLLTVEAAGHHAPAVALGGALIHLEPGEHRDGVDLALERGITAEVRIRLPGDAIPRGAGVFVASGRYAELFKAEYDETPPLPEARGLGNGRFVIDGMGRGAYQVMVWAQGYREMTMPLVVDGTEDPVILEADLEPNPSLTGRVEDGEGNPIAGAAVRASHFVTLEYRIKSPELFREECAFTDDRGAFMLTEQPLGAMRILAEAPGFLPNELRPERVQPDRPLVMVLERGGPALAGRVKDDGGNPVAGAAVMTDQRGTLRCRHEVRTGPDGTFRIDGLSRGRITLHAQSKAGASRKVSITLGTGTKTVELRLTRFGRIEGRATDSRGDPAEAFNVTATSPDMSFKGRAPGEDGAFIIDPAPSGTVSVYAWREGLTVEQSAQIEVKPGETKTGVHLVLVPYGEARGTVRDGKNGKPLEGCSIFYKTMPRGTWRITSPPGRDGPGRYLPSSRAPARRVRPHGHPSLPWPRRERDLHRDPGRRDRGDRHHVEPGRRPGGPGCSKARIPSPVWVWSSWRTGPAARIAAGPGPITKAPSGSRTSPRGTMSSWCPGRPTA